MWLRLSKWRSHCAYTVSCQETLRAANITIAIKKSWRICTQDSGCLDNRLVIDWPPSVSKPDNLSTNNRDFQNSGYSFPAFVNAVRQAMVLDYFTRAWENKRIQRHLLSIAPNYYQRGHPSCGRLSGHWERTDRPLGTMPAESTETAPKSPAWEAGLLDMVDLLTKRTALLQQLPTKIETKSAKQQQSCFKCGGPQPIELLPEKNQLSKKRRRFDTGLSFSVTRSQVLERASQNDAAAQDEQGEWTAVKKKWEWKKQAWAKAWAK